MGVLSEAPARTEETMLGDCKCVSEVLRTVLTKS